MARETTGGRIGKTVYLPPELWDKLSDQANGRIPIPGVARWNIRSGSVSAVIESLLTSDAWAKVQRLEAENADLRQKNQRAEQLKEEARRLVGALSRFVDAQ